MEDTHINLENDSPILTASVNGKLYALNAHTQKILWTSELRSPVSLGSLHTIMRGQLKRVKSVRHYEPAEGPETRRG